MQVKIWVPLLVIIGSIGWLAATNFDKANYFYTVEELPPLGNPVFDNAIKVKGRIVAGSIDKTSVPLSFTIEDKGKNLRVHYVSDEPLPDMFKDHAETVVEGNMRADGEFEASHLQAKCASKYEAAGPEAEHPDSIAIESVPVN